MLSALSAHRTKSAGRFCTRVQKVYFNETAECTQWTVKRNALCRLDDFIPFSGSSRLLIPWRSLGLDEILFFLDLVASIPLRPGHQIRHIFCFLVVEVLRHLLQQILQIVVRIRLVGLGCFNQCENHDHHLGTARRETEEAVASKLRYGSH